MVRYRIKEIAAEKDISQNLLSHRAETTVRTIRRLYREPHPDVSMYTLEKIAKALGVSVKDLFIEVEEDEDKEKQG